MKTQHLNLPLRLLVLPLLIVSVFVTSCSDDPASPTKETPGNAMVKGTLKLPVPAPDEFYAVVIDDDDDQDNPPFAYFEGTCCGGMEIPYSIADVAEGTYFIYALVRLVSDPDGEPADGDLIGVYGGSLANWPSQPNASVPASGTVVFDLTLETFHDGPGSGEGPVINWDPPSHLVHYNYSGGSLVSCETYMAAECTGQDGDVEISASLYTAGSGTFVTETTATLPMLAGNRYWLTATMLVSSSEYINNYRLVWSSPNAGVDSRVTFGLYAVRARSIHGPFLD